MKPTDEQIDQMLVFVLDTKDKNIIDNYRFRLKELMADFEAGIEHEKPTISFGGKTYEGRKLSFVGNRMFIDGKQISDGNANNFLANAENENMIFVSGNVTIERCDKNLSVFGKIKSDSIIVGNNLNCDDVQANRIQSEKNVYCRTANVKEIRTNHIDIVGTVNADKIICNGMVISGKK
jgi:hypothetical protein